MSLSVKNMLQETENSRYQTNNKDVNIQQVRIYVSFNRCYPIEIETMLYNHYQVRVFRL